MRLLLTNDDGYLAPGLECLARAMEALGEVDVVAPDRDRSGASHSLTLDNPLRVHRARNGFQAVTGTPTDCVHLAITGLLRHEPDIVVSGINAGPNLGDDVLYSGTVAAAMEGRFLGLPSVAVSLVHEGAGHYETAARAVSRLLRHLRPGTIPSDSVLNLNVPDLPWERIAGFCATRLGHRHRAEPVVRSEDPRGQPIYWVGPPGGEQDAGPGTDFDAVRRGFVSVTPLQIDITRHASLESTARWIGSLEVE